MGEECHRREVFYRQGPHPQVDLSHFVSTEGGLRIGFLSFRFGIFHSRLDSMELSSAFE